MVVRPFSVEIEPDDALSRQFKATESPITRIFGGKFRSTLRAPRQKDSVIVEDWRSLRLDIQVRLPSHFG